MALATAFNQSEQKTRIGGEGKHRQGSLVSRAEGTVSHGCGMGKVNFSLWFLFRIGNKSLTLCRHLQLPRSGVVASSAKGADL